MIAPNTDSLIPDGFDLVIEGVTVRVEFTPDDLTNPHEEGCWNLVERHQFNIGNWRFATLTVTPVLAGKLWDLAAVDVCGVAVGECLGEWTANPVPLATDLAREAVARLRELVDTAHTVLHTLHTRLDAAA